MHSKNWMKMGARWDSSEFRKWPARFWNWCPKEMKSFSIRVWNPRKVRKWGSRKIWAKAQSWEVRSQPSEQCTNTFFSSFFIIIYIYQKLFLKIFILNYYLHGLCDSNSSFKYFWNMIKPLTLIQILMPFIWLLLQTNLFDFPKISKNLTYNYP